MSRAAAAAIVSATVWLGGCSLWGTAETAGVPIGLVAVLPFEIAAQPSGTPAVGEERAPLRVTSDASRGVTAQVYAVLAERSDFRFVPDLTVADTVRNTEVTGAATLMGRALALGKLVQSDGVIFGTVSRFEERVGTEYGATSPASVSFELQLLATRSGELVWRGNFDETQQPLTSNLFKFWMFWEGGPRWLTARELTRVGVERLFEDMAETAEEYKEAALQRRAATQTPP
jgi:hypothetical protein